jgi:cytochrome P450
MALDLLGPLPALLATSAAGPVVRVPAPTGDEVWLVRDYGLARLVLTDPRFSRAAAVRPDAPKVNTANPAPSSMMSMDGAEHARLRRLVAGAFGPRRIAALAPDVERLVDSSLTAMSTMERPVDLVAAFAGPLPIAVISTLLGVPAEDQPLVQEWAGVLFDVTASTPREKARRGFALFQYMAKLVQRKRLAPADDLLCDLVAAHDAGAVTETELVDLALAILTAGYETTVAQIGMSVLSLLLDPVARAELLRDQTSTGVVEEYLRLTPATPMTFSRVAVEDVDLGGVTVEAGQAVVVSLLHANVDEAVFVDPDRLDPGRQPVAHLTFGRGAHFCLGAGLARLQLNLAVRALFQRLPDLRLADGPDAVGWYDGLATRGLTHLMVTW